jgi:hypothetical protein
MLISLIAGLSPHIYAIDHPNPTETIDVFCKIRGYTGQSSTMMYRWLMTMACIDRYMISSENVYLRELANPRIAYSIIVKILTICIIVPIHNLLFLDTHRGWCVFPTSALSFYHCVFTFTFGALLPILIMIISCILIRSNLALKQARRYRNISRKNENRTIRLLSTRDHQVLFMLFIQVIVYILSTIPWMIFLLYGPYSYHIRNRSMNRFMIEKFLKYLAEICIYLYPTLSFYIYTLTSHTFRGALVNIICSLSISRDRSRHAPQQVLIQEEVSGYGQLDQSNNIYQFKSTEMEIFLDSSSKTISS